MKKLLVILLAAVMLTSCGVETNYDKDAGNLNGTVVDTSIKETDVPETESVEIEPAATEFAETEPVETEPVATEPVATEPVATEPVATEPAATEPVATEPVATEPAATEPAATEPEATEPAEIEPVETDPVVTEPAATEQAETEPEETEPKKEKARTPAWLLAILSKLNKKETWPAETEPVETEPVETEPVETEPVETEPVETEPVETEPVETEPVETEPVETEPVETEPVETEPAETEPAETEPPVIEPEVECVRYSDFGAVGDGVTDDYDAIVAAHAYANEQGLPVVADEGATYYIGESDKCAIIRTNTTWTGATFIIDDTSLVPWQSDINTLFLVDGDEYVEDFEINSLRKGQKHLGFAPGEKLLVTVENENIIQYIRRYVDYNAGTAMSDTFVVDADGNILSDIIWNFDEITKTTAKRIGEPLVIEGGTFLHKVNRHNSESYFSRNIKIIRSNTTVQNLTMKVIDEGDVGSPYMGFITVIETAYVNLKNLKLDAYNSFGGTMGTYAMQINYSANTTLDNVIQTNDILDEGRWGIMNTNFCKDFVVKNSTLNRYDSHMGVTNCTIENSTIGTNGVNLIGHGDFVLKNSTVYNDCLFILRADYGATWDGDIYVENVDWYHSSRYPSIIYARNDSQHDFGYTCYQPHNVYIDGLDIYEYNAPAGQNYPRILCYYVRDEEIGTLSPYVLCERVVVNNLRTESGIPTYLSFNEGDYPDTIWEITNSNIVEEYLPRLD